MSAIREVVIPRANDISKCDYAVVPISFAISLSLSHLRELGQVREWLRHPSAIIAVKGAP